MKKIVLGIVFGIGLSLNAFEPGQLTLDSVSNFEDGDAGFSIRHRFYGDVTKAEEFFGLDNGSNTMIGFRYAPLKWLIFETHHTSEGKTYNARVGLAYNSDYLHGQLNVNYFSFQAGGIEARRENIFANVVLQSPLILSHIRLTTNLGYDNYYERSGAGFGIEWNAPNFMPTVLTFTESMSLLFEYYTKHDELENFDREHNAYSFGVKFRTFGHHFELLGSNAIATDPRSMMQGTDSNVIHFGFNINRKF